MALSTIAFCDHCKWRSSVNASQYNAAGAPCPTCGHGVSALHCDPTYTGTDPFGRPYVEATEIAAHLTRHGVSTVAPVGVALPQHPVITSTPVVGASNG